MGSVESVFWRALGYSSTYLLALLSSLAAANGSIARDGIPAALALWLISTPLFISYALAFPYGNDYAGVNRRDAIRIGPAGSLLLLALVVLVSFNAGYDGLLRDRGFIAYSALMAFLQWVYAAFLYQNVGAQALVEEEGTGAGVYAARHAFVIPMVLTVGFGLYAGTAIDGTSDGLFRFGPIAIALGLLVLAFSSSLRVGRALLILLGLGSAATVALLLEAWPPLANLMTYTFLAAYLAGLEAWRYISVLLKHGAPIGASLRAYRSTSVVVGVAGPLVLLMYLTQFVGVVGLISFGALIALATLVWHTLSGSVARLKSERTALIWKLILGFGLLGTLAADRLTYPRIPAQEEDCESADDGHQL